MGHLDDDDRRRLARLAHDLGWRPVGRHARIVTVATLRRWWRDLIATATAHPRRGGRRPVPAATVELILQMVRENSLGNDAWGRRRISGELLALGETVSPSSVRRILARHGIPPASARGRAWEGPVAVAASDPATVALDFTTVAVGLGDQQSTVYALAAIHIGSRRVDILGLTEHPDEAWMAQIARNLRMEETGFLHRVGARAVIIDRDTKFTAQFRHLMSEGGIPALRLPPKMPQCNGYIERWFRTLKTSLIRKAIWLDEEILRQAIVEFAHEHYLRERPHEALSNRPPMPPDGPIATSGQVIRHDRFGGLIHVYRRAA